MIKQDLSSQGKAAAVEAYGKTYRKEFKDRSAVFYSHVSKSCGTMLCSCSWDSGCRAFGKEHNIGDNCHAFGDGTPQDMPLWNGEQRRDANFESCDSLEKYNVENGFTLEA